MEKFWKNDEELFAAVREELFTAVVGDAIGLATKSRTFFLRPMLHI